MNQALHTTVYSLKVWCCYYMMQTDRIQEQKNENNNRSKYIFFGK